MKRVLIMLVTGTLISGIVAAVASFGGPIAAAQADTGVSADGAAVAAGE